MTIIALLIHAPDVAIPRSPHEQGSGTVMIEGYTEIMLEDLDLPELGGEQKECVLGLITQIRSDIILISDRKFEVGISMARLYDIAGRGSFEPLRKRFFPEVPRRSAQRWTAVGRDFGSYKEYVLDIGFSYLGKLAEQEVLGPIRSELIEHIKQGKKADGSCYRAKIVELLKEEDEPEGIRNEGIENKNARSEATKKNSERKSNVQEKIDDRSKDVVDRCIPTDPVQLQALWNVLSTTKEKQKITKYLYKRVSELIRHTVVQHPIEIEEPQEDSPEPVCH